VVNFLTLSILSLLNPHRCTQIRHRKVPRRVPYDDQRRYLQDNLRDYLQCPQICSSACWMQATARCMFPARISSHLTKAHVKQQYVPDQMHRSDGTSTTATTNGNFFSRQNLIQNVCIKTTVLWCGNSRRSINIDKVSCQMPQSYQSSTSIHEFSRKRKQRGKRAF
jgi:hypothetical protein